MFNPHPNLANEVNRSIIQSEIEGGVFLNDLPPSTVLEIQTMHHRYTAVLLGGSEALLSGHPEFCPEPVQVASIPASRRDSATGHTLRFHDDAVSLLRDLASDAERTASQQGAGGAGRSAGGAGKRSAGKGAGAGSGRGGGGRGAHRGSGGGGSSGGGG